MAWKIKQKLQYFQCVVYSMFFIYICVAINQDQHIRQFRGIDDHTLGLLLGLFITQSLQGANIYMKYFQIVLMCLGFYFLVPFSGDSHDHNHDCDSNDDEHNHINWHIMFLCFTLFLILLLIQYIENQDKKEKFKDMEQLRYKCEYMEKIID